MDNKPIFSVSAQAISMVAEISALLEHHNIAQQKTDSLKLRKINQIKTIQSSLAIEGNSLSEKQVTDILNGKNANGSKSRGSIGEVKTGEGKSFIIAILAILLVKVYKRKIDVVTSNIELAT